MHHPTHPVEAAVLIHDLNDGHGTHKEEQCRTGVTQVVLNDVRDKRKYGIHGASEARMLEFENVHKLRVHELDEIARIEHIQRPDNDEHKQSHGGFVYLRHTLQGYEEIAHDEHDNDRDR